MSETTKRGRGRPKGSLNKKTAKKSVKTSSFTKVNISTLIERFNFDVQIPVSRTWLKEIGLELGKAKPVAVKKAVEEEAGDPEEKIQFVIH